MSVEVNSELLAEIKNFLDITWEDEAGDKKLSGIILRGMKKINELCGTEFDYSTDTDDSSAKELLINYVMYARAGAIEDFMKNYAPEINRLQLLQEVINFGAAEQKKAKQGTV